MSIFCPAFASPQPTNHSSTSGFSPGDGAGDSSGADGSGGYLPSHLFLSAAGWECAGQLCRAEVYRGPTGRLAAQSG